MQNKHTTECNVVPGLPSAQVWLAKFLIPTIFFLFSSFSLVRAQTTWAPTGSGPTGIVIDAAGNIYTTNFNANTVTKITPTGVSSTFATTGSGPTGIVIDAAGNIYTTNFNANTVTKITPTGVSSTFATTGAAPTGIVIDAAGNIYTTNFYGNTVTKITPTGVSSTFATTGSNPAGMVIDGSGNIYVANAGDGTVTKITPAGVSSTFTTMAGPDPQGMVIDASGNIYVTNNVSNTVTKITPTGVSSTFATTGSNPQGIIIDASGNIYVANSGDNTVTKITPAGVTSVLGTTGSAPYGIAIDAAGNIYTTNNGDNTVTKIPITTPLPIKLISFNACLRGEDAVQLTWVTPLETNRGFDIERSKDGINFTKIAFVDNKANLNSSTLTLDYKTTDENPLAGNNFYRLKLIDIDGRFSYSNIVNVQITTAGKVLSLGVYPNPITNSSKIVIGGIAEFQSAFLTILNELGRVVIQQPVSQSVITGIDFDKLPNGIYHLVYADATGNRLYAKMVK